MKYLNKIRESYALFLILLLASILRFYHLDFQSAWLDEAHTLVVTDPKYPLSVLHDKIIKVEGTPHLFFLIVRGLSEVFGHSMFVLRFLSAFLGTLSVYYIFLLAKEMFNKKAALISAMLLTINIFHIENSQEARSYALFVFLVIFSYHRMLNFVKNQSVKNTILLGLFAGLIPNAHLFGVLNTASIYVSLFYFSFLVKGKMEKIIFLKHSFSALIISFVVFLPVIQIINNLSNSQSHWIPAASWDGIKSVFIDLLGRVEILAVLSLFFVVIYIIYYSFNKVKNNSKIEDDYNFIILMVWLTLCISTIIIKSYVGDASLILSRYFIGVLPAFIIISAFVLSLIKSKIIRGSIIAFILLFSSYTIFIKREYYTKINKSQFDLLTKEIADKNYKNDLIVANYGWFLNYYFDDSKSNNFNLSDFSNYISSMRKNTVDKNSFWYYDGNSRPLNLNTEDQIYLNENFVVDYDLNNYYDCWAKHYKLKSNNDLGTNEFIKVITIADFSPKILDNKGSLFIFENGSIQTQPLFLELGNYEFFLKANSLPEKPIDNRNAHIALKINDEKIGEDFLSEKKQNQDKKYTFTVSDTSPKIISLRFDNDIAKDDLDRNVVIYYIQIKKIDN